jgi:hypothetical protein
MGIPSTIAVDEPDQRQQAFAGGRLMEREPEQCADHEDSEDHSDLPDERASSREIDRGAHEPETGDEEKQPGGGPSVVPPEHLSFVAGLQNPL